MAKKSMEKKLFALVLPLLVLGIFSALAYNALEDMNMSNDEVMMLEIFGLLGLVSVAPLVKVKGDAAKLLDWIMVIVGLGLVLAIVPPLLGMVILPPMIETVVLVLAVVGALVAFITALKK